MDKETKVGRVKSNDCEEQAVYAEPSEQGAHAMKSSKDKPMDLYENFRTARHGEPSVSYEHQGGDVYQLLDKKPDSAEQSVYRRPDPRLRDDPPEMKAIDLPKSEDEHDKKMQTKDNAADQKAQEAETELHACAQAPPSVTENSIKGRQTSVLHDSPSSHIFQKATRPSSCRWCASGKNDRPVFFLAVLLGLCGVLIGSLAIWNSTSELDTLRSKLHQFEESVKRLDEKCEQRLEERIQQLHERLERQLVQRSDSLQSSLDKLTTQLTNVTDPLVDRLKVSLDTLAYEVQNVTVPRVQQLASSLKNVSNRLENATRDNHKKISVSNNKLQSKLSTFDSSLRNQISALSNTFQSKLSSFNTSLRNQCGSGKGRLVGWRSRDWINIDRLRSNNLHTVVKLTYKKQRNDTFLRLTFYSVRMERDNDTCSQWYFMVDKKECAPNSVNGHTYRRITTPSYSSIEMSSTIVGLCRSTLDGDLLSGTHEVSMHVRPCSWSSHGPQHNPTPATGIKVTTTMLVEEMCPPQ